MNGSAYLQELTLGVRAARQFPVLAGASVLHVRLSPAGNLTVRGREVPARRFCRQVVAELALPPGQPLVLVGYGAAAPPGAALAAGSALARAACRWVLMIGGAVQVGARGQLVLVGIAADGRLATGPGRLTLLAPDGQLSRTAGPDLSLVLRDGRLTRAARGPRRVIQWTAAAAEAAGVLAS